MNVQKAVASLGRTVGDQVLNPLGFMRRKTAPPGSRPGIEHLAEAATPPAAGMVSITCLDYGPDYHRGTAVEDLDGFLEQERPKECAVRWINVNGLHAYTIRRLQQTFSFHSLVAEDALNANQRPKVEAYDDHLFVVARMLMEDDGKPVVEQVSLIVFEGTVITLQERPGDVWDSVRTRINSEGGRLRTNGAGFLVYALLDAVVDNFFPVLERYGDRLDDIEARVLARPTPQELQALYKVKQELILLRRVIWPTRQAIDELLRSERKEIGDMARTYLRDVQDHSFQVIDIVEAYRETSSSLTDLYMSSVANRMNEVMKVLTIMSSVFIPTTFLAGVYGMNFEYIPGLDQRWAFGLFCAICLMTTGGLVLFFRHKGWIGGSSEER